MKFVGSSRKDIQQFPKTVRYDIGFDIYNVQIGKTPDSAKQLKGINGVMEIVNRYDTDTYRAVYTTNIGDTVYVLHCFKKKSKRGIKTPKKEIDLIRERLKVAHLDAKNKKAGEKNE
ncbi:MAG: type II toxin-antitoxin system RelE/ParE family toxin [Thermodesulfobacteriota bacterium]